MYIRSQAKRQEFCIDMFMYIYIYIYVYVYIYTHTYIRICTYIYIYLYTHLYMYLYVKTFTRTHNPRCKRSAYICTYTYLYIYLYMQTHIYLYIYMYIQTHNLFLSGVLSHINTHPGPIPTNGNWSPSQRIYLCICFILLICLEWIYHEFGAYAHNGDGR